MEKADRINEIVSMKQAKKDWQWWKIFKTEKIQIPEDLDEKAIFLKLNDALKQVFNFENSLASKL